MKTEAAVLIFDAVMGTIVAELEYPEECHFRCKMLNCFVPFAYLRKADTLAKVSFTRSLMQGYANVQEPELIDVEYIRDGSHGVKKLDIKISRTGDELMHDLFKSAMFDISDRYNDSEMLYEVGKTR